MTFVKRIASATAIGMALLVGSGTISSPAQAGFVVTLKEIGSDVIATGSGALDLTGLTANATSTISGYIIPTAAEINTGPVNPRAVSLFQGSITGPQSFGTGGQTFADSGNGDLVGIDGIVSTLAVPFNYVSGHALSDTSTYLNQTFATLGVTPGTYEWTWGTGRNQNFTVNVGLAAVPVPEPASAALLATAFVGLLLVGTIRRRQAEA